LIFSFSYFFPTLPLCICKKLRTKQKEIMAVEIKIDGYFEIVFKNIKTNERVDLETETTILRKLKSTEYAIDMEKREVNELEDLEFVLYTFDLVPTFNTSYEFNQL